MEKLGAAAVLALVLMSSAAYACTSLVDNTSVTINTSTTLCGGATYNLTRVQLNADNIVFNCNGSTLDGLDTTPDYRAFSINDVDNTTVMNCNVQFYEYGYYAQFSESTINDFVVNNTFYNNSIGVYNLNNYYLQVINNTFYRNDVGVDMRSADYYNIQGNNFTDQLYSAVDLGSFTSIRYSTFSGNRFRNDVSASSLINLDEQLTHSVVEYNVVEKSTGPFMAFGSSLTVNNITIRKNNITNTNYTAFTLYRFINSKIEGNFINVSLGYGMNLGDSVNFNNTVENNTIIGNGSGTNYGIYLFPRFDNGTVRGNNVTGFVYAIYIYPSVFNVTVYNNIFNSSSDSLNYNETNNFNVSQDCSRTNVIGGACIGGNFWAKPDGSGFSQNCTDANTDGFCDLTYNTGGVIDYLPLSTFIGSDTTAPQISSVQANATNSTANVTWSTSEAANSSVSYGTTPGLGTTSGSSGSATSHFRPLSVLQNGTLYFYNVTSCDTAGNCNTTGIYNFTTLYANPTVPINVVINWTEWDGNTTNLTAYNNSALVNVSNLTFSNPKGSISFLNNVSINQSIDTTGKIVITPLSIFVNTSALPMFNKSATLTFRNVSLSHPVVKRDGSDCTICSSSLYNSTAKTFQVNITSFSNYTLAEQCSDGLQNYDETGTDCGGSCNSCPVQNPGGGGGGGGSGGSSQPSNSTQNKTTGTNQTTTPVSFPVEALTNFSNDIIDGILPNMSLDSLTGEKEPIEIRKDLLVIPAVIALCIGYAAWIRKHKKKGKDQPAKQPDATPAAQPSK